MISAERAPEGIRLERTMRAPPERVFEAFLDPVLIRRWIAPDDLDVDRVTVDPRVGGRIEVWHSRHGASTGKFEGRFLKIDPPRELVYTWAFVGTEPERGEYFETLVTLNFEPAPGNRTRLSVHHAKLEELRRGAPHIHVALLPGWNNCLEKLDRSTAPAAR